MFQELVTTRGNLQIRAGKPEDWQALRTLRLEAVQTDPEAFSADLKSQLERSPEAWAGLLPPEMKTEAGGIFFAASENGLVGMAGIRRGSSEKTQHSAMIWGVYVQPAWRGMQIAGALIEACLDWAARQGVSIVHLGVNSSNSAAIRCYARCGFRVYGLEPQAIRYGGRDYDILLMAKPVAPSEKS